MQEKAYPIEKPDFRKRKTMLFIVPNRKLSYTEIFATKTSMEIVAKSSLIAKNRLSVPSFSNVLVGVKIVRQPNLRFFFWEANLSF